MKIDILTLLLSVTLLATSTGCGSAPASSAVSGETAVQVDAGQFKLAEEPDGAVGVIDARESAEDGAPLVLVGRIGGAENPWIDGRAAFTLLDASMSVVAEGNDNAAGEICMADCCASERLNCTTIVKMVDEEGQLIGVDSRDLLGVKEADMVVVKGTARKDESGNLVMLANGIYVRD